MTELAVPSRLPWYAVGFADLLLVFFTLGILQTAGSGMVDDPGLGWHLRIADRMWESRGFIFSEPFCYPTEGQPAIAHAWLGDIVLRLAYGWGGLNGVAVLTALCLAWTLCLLYTRMTCEGTNWLVAAAWTFLAALGTSCSWLARPNVFTFPALVLVAGLCERYHAGAISAKKTLWLLPVFLLWPNLHGGFLAGILVLAVTYFVECALSLAASRGADRRAARKRLRWWTILGASLFAVTLVNPYGMGLYRWNLRMITDPFIRSGSTTEWLAPNFTEPGWFRIELLVLLFPLLAALNRHRISPLPLALGVVWLHFGLTGARYSPLWVVVVVPTLAVLTAGIPWLTVTAKKAVGGLSADLRTWVAKGPPQSSPFLGLALSALLLFASPWMGNLARHDQDLIPSQSLDKLLEMYHGERVFHWANWGGYLTWHGWDCHPRFKTWINDRLDIHGQEATERYRAVIQARPGWEGALRAYGVELLCIPPGSPLARAARESPNWRAAYEDARLTVFRRVESSAWLPDARNSAP